MITYEIIRTKEQCEDLKALATEISLEHFTPITGEGQVYYMMEKFLAPEVVMREIGENYEFAFILYGGERAGYYSIAFEGEALFLSKLYVKQSFRGLGLGRAMFEKIVEKALAAGCKYIYLTVNKHNDSSIAIYKKWGFYVHEEVQTNIGGGYVMDDYIMRMSCAARQRAISEIMPCRSGREIFARIRVSNMRAYLPRKSEMFLPKSW